MPTKDSLTVWALQEQEALWNDLDHAITYAANGYWSMGSEGIAYRLVQCIRLVGPVSPGDIPWTLLAGGVYCAVLDLAGVAHPMPTTQQWADWDRAMASHGGTREELQAKMAPTIAAMKADRQLKADLEYEED